MQDSENPTAKFVGQLLSTTSYDELNQLIEANEDLLYPELHHYIWELAENPDFKDFREILYSISTVLTPRICRNTIWYWLNITDEKKAKNALRTDLAYIANDSGADLWETLETNEKYEANRAFFAGKLGQLKDYVVELVLRGEKGYLTSSLLASMTHLSQKIDWKNIIDFETPAQHEAQAKAFVELSYTFGRSALSYTTSYSDLSIGFLESALGFYKKDGNLKFSALILNDLSISYRSKLTGDRFSDTAKAIEFALEALETTDKEDSTDEWCMFTNTLGNAYLEIQSEENIEKAIATFQSITSITDIISTPGPWSNAQHNLGICFRKRIAGDKAKNMDQAIVHYENSLRVRTREVMPMGWAMTQYNLGILYSKRLHGDLIDNDEKAIYFFRSALLELTEEKNPYEWANVHWYLADMFYKEIENASYPDIESAIDSYEKAIKIFTFEYYSEAWIQIQQRIGKAYFRRIGGSKEDNIEKSITAYENILRLTGDNLLGEVKATIEHDLAIDYMERTYVPNYDNIDQWAFTQSNLINAYRRRWKRAPVRSIEESIALSTRTLNVGSREKLPAQWALTNFNLGIGYLIRVLGDSRENIKTSIDKLTLALSYYSPEKDPFFWANVQHSLGVAFTRFDNLTEREPAIEHFKASLNVRKPDVLPADCLRSAKSLGLEYYRRQEYQLAIEALEMAHQAFENVRGEAANTVSREQLTADNINIYEVLISCYIKQENFEKAFEFTSISKGRSLAEKLSSQKPDINKLAEDNEDLAALWYELESIWNNIEELEKKALTLLRTDADTKDNKIYNDPRFVTLRREIERLHSLREDKKEEFVYKFPAVASSLIISPINIDNAKTLAGNLNSSIVEYYAHADGWIAFIITADEFHAIPLDKTSDRVIFDAASWAFYLGNSLPASYSTVRQKRIFRNFYDVVLSPVQGYLKPDTSLIIAPYQNLHHIPFGLALTETGECFFESQEYFLVANISIANALYQQKIKNRAVADERENEELLVVVNSGEGKSKLKYTLEEVEIVKSSFDSFIELDEHNATPKKVIEAAKSKSFNTIHFSCHGNFDHTNADLSGLFLNGTLTVERIMNELYLTQNPLVVLSACQTGVSMVRQGDELSGLNQALFQAGAGNIISSLWSVNDRSTMVLFKNFYDERNRDRKATSTALRHAMQQTRATAGYERPFFWAAFQIYGLPETLN